MGIDALLWKGKWSDLSETGFFWSALVPECETKKDVWLLIRITSVIFVPL